MSSDKIVFLHVDIDSPLTLSKFWGLPEPEEPLKILSDFYRTAMERALGLFEECGVAATFFCVGRELAVSPEAARCIFKAFSLKHEIANHSFSHPFNFSRLPLDEIEKEIRGCSRVISEITGKSPMGFRAPGYHISPAVIRSLETMGIEYDSSVFLSSLNAALNFYYKAFRKNRSADGFSSGLKIPAKLPYYPAADGGNSEGAPKGKILEIPMPNSFFFRLPFYNNFHLSTGELYRRLDLSWMRQAIFPYLFHLIEFCDLTDAIPSTLRRHPNVAVPAQVKIKRMKNSIAILKKRYTIMRSDKFVSRTKCDAAQGKK